MKYLLIVLCLCLSACQSHTPKVQSTASDRASNGLIVFVVDRPGVHSRPGIYPAEVIANANSELQLEIWRRTRSGFSRFYIIPTYDGCQILVATPERLTDEEYTELWHLADFAIEKASAEYRKEK